MSAFVKKLSIGILAAAASAALPGTAQAQLFYMPPAFAVGPVEPGEQLVSAPLTNPTAAETRAALIWNLRSGLNVAALRCQFSKYLRSVDNYNAVLDHHSEELAQAYQILGNHFRRIGGNPREGQRRLDAWSTLTYNNYSTIAGQASFCQTAGNIGKDALTRRKGEFHELARDRMRELRNSLAGGADRIYTVAALRPLPLGF